MNPQHRRTFCHIIGTLLVSDIELRDSELAYLHDLYRRLGIDEAESKSIEAEVNVGDDVKALAATLPPDTRVKLLDEMHRAAMADGTIQNTERSIIRRVEELFT